MKVNQRTKPQTLKNKKTVDFKVKYKTQKCRYLIEHGYCPYGDMCAFAHDDIQIRQKSTIHNLYKTKLCLNFSKYGWCKYGNRCLFLHQQTEKPQEDHERTRSNSPASIVEEKIKPSNFKKHGANLRILSEFGFDVFQAHMKRGNSRVVNENYFEEIENPQLYNIKYDFLDVPVINKKNRMYSL